MPSTKNLTRLSICAAYFLFIIGCLNNPKEEKNDLALLLPELEYALEKQLLEVWYPRVVDSINGGYWSDFDYQWNRKGTQNKMIVSQARHVWMTSKAAEFTGDKTYSDIAKHGFQFLKTHMWDAQNGGFYNLVDQTGSVKTDPNGDNALKLAYGNAFAIYGLAAYYHISKDTAVLNLAKNAFHWLDQHSYDPVHGGYFQFLQQDGTPLPNGFNNTPPKDQNSSIHLLEAFSELYKVWPDPLLKERLEALLKTIRDTITTEKGYMNLFFWEDWTPASYQDSSAEVRKAHYNLDHVSFGHDIETAYLMMEASEVLGLENDTHTLKIGKKMVDHSLQNGWDKEVGGLYDRGYYFAGDTAITIIMDSKNWWAQAETLNSLLIMAELYPNNKLNYAELFKKQWNYCKTYLIDSEYGGWYSGGLDKEPERKTHAKAQIWKTPYHTGRALMNCIFRLRSLSEKTI